MNHASTVIKFVLICFLLYIGFSALSFVFSFSWQPFQNINLLADVIHADKSTGVTKEKNNKETTEVNVYIAPSVIKRFEVYQYPGVITDFNSQNKQAALLGLMQKLHTLKATGKGKVRIAYFGDSMIEGDLITQTIRKLLQKEFGGNGVGYLPVTSPVAKFRTTASTMATGNWEDINFKSKKHNSLFLSGHQFLGNTDAEVTFIDRTADSSALLNKILLFGTVHTENNEVDLEANGNKIFLHSNGEFNTLMYSKDGSPKLKLSRFGYSLPLYGVSFESENGVIVDNFSFRGITGIELNQIDSSFLQQVAGSHSYDLIVFQYGVNMLFRPEDKNFSWYGRAFRPVLDKFKKSFPNSNMILVSTADRAFRYNGTYESAHGIDSLIKVQAGIAFNCGIGFYNQFETMGGHESIVRWADSTPSLANKDYVHPNFRGAELLGNYFYEALMKDYKKYTTNLP